MTNLGFALLAPFFITFEVMNQVFGYQEGPKMHKLKSLIEEDIREYHAGYAQDSKTK